MAGGDGLKSALDLAIGQGQAGAPPGAAAAEQLPLLSDPKVEFARNVDLQVVEGEGPRGPGRPKGSRNKRTEEWIEFILANYGSPLVHLAKTMVADPADLAKAMGVKRAEATMRQQAAAIALLPYIHQKLPQSIELDKGVTVLNLTVVRPNETVQGVLDGSIIEVVENQQDSDEGSGDV